MANTTIKITQLPSIGNNLTAGTVLPVVAVNGITPVTDKTTVGNIANFTLTNAGSTLPPALLSIYSQSVTNAAQPNITSVGTLTGLTINNINNLNIPGGDNGYYIQTDGAGNLTWVAGGGSGNGEVGGADRQIQFNNAGNFGGDVDLTWVDGNVVTTGIQTDGYFYANGDPFVGTEPHGPSGAVQINWQGGFSNQGGTPGDTYSTLQFDSNGMPTLDGTNAYQQRVDNSPYLQVLAPRVESTDYGIVAGPAIQITGYADDTFYNTPRSAYLTVQDQANATQQWDFGILGNGNNNFTVRDRTSSNEWSFGTDGNLTLPSNASSINYANGSPYGGGGSSNKIANGTSSVEIAVVNGNVVTTAGSNVWTFGTDGNFTVPGSGTFIGDNFYIGPGANTQGNIGGSTLVISSSDTAYVQASIFNVSDIGSADWTAYGHHGDDDGGWIDMGFNSAGYNDPTYNISGPGDGALLVQSFYENQAPGGRGGNLILGTGENGTVNDIIFGTGGFSNTNIFGRISNANNSFELSRSGASLKFPDGSHQTTAYIGPSVNLVPNEVTYTTGTIYGNTNSGFTVVTLTTDQDDASYSIPVDFPIEFLGNSYSAGNVRLCTNSYLTFGPTDYHRYQPIGPGIIPAPAIFIGAADLSSQKYYYGYADGTDTFVIGYEGSINTGGTTDYPAIVWELQVSATTPNILKIVADSVDQSPGGVWGLSDGVEWVDQFLPLVWYSPYSNASYDSIIIAPVTPVTANTIAFVGPGVTIGNHEGTTYVNIDPFTGAISVSDDGGDTILSSTQGDFYLTTARDGDSTTIKPKGYAYFSGGDASNNQPGVGYGAVIYGGNANDDPANVGQQYRGGYVSLRGGKGVNGAANGIVDIRTSNDTHIWTFDGNGDTTFPGNISLQGGVIQGGTPTVVTDGINSITLGLGAQMDVYEFPFSQTTRGQLTISGSISTTQALGTWYYQSVNTNTFQLYTDNTYSTLVDASGWTAYTGGGVVAITKQVPAANIVIDSNGFLTTFDNTGNLVLPTGGEIKTAVGTGNVVIEANDGTVRTWTFKSIGTLNLPDFGAVPGSGDGAVGDMCRNGDVLYFKTSTGWKTVGLS